MQQIIANLVNIYRDNNAANAFLLLIYGLLLKLPYLLHPHVPVAGPSDGFLFIELLKYLHQTGTNFPVIYSIIAFLLLLTQAFTLNRLMNEQRLMPAPNYLVAMAYLLVTSLIPEWNYLSSVLIVNTVMVWAWPRMVSLYNNHSAKTLLYNISLGFGICSFFYTSSLFLLVLLIVAILVFRPFNITEWIVALMGVLTPYYFLFAYLFMTDQLHLSTLFPAFTFSLPKIDYDYWFWLRIAFLVFPMVVGMYYIQSNTGRMLIQVRKSWALMSFYLLIAVFIPFINPVPSYVYWILCTVPLAAFHAATYYYPRRPAFPNYLHWIIVAFIVVAYLLA